MGRTVPYEQTGRVNQKARTREALVDATRELLAEGTQPTMEAAAARASMSRTTAYRYFPSTRALLVATYPHIEQESLLDADAPDEPLARLEAVVDNHMRRILTFEREQRTVLRLSLEPDHSRALTLPMHRGMRIGWIEDALAPLRGRLEADQLRRLVLGIGATIGIEAFVWLTDIAKLSGEDAVAVMRSNAIALLCSAIAPRAGADPQSPEPHAGDREPA
jgi:AcrR family transcriptional regulator